MSPLQKQPAPVVCDAARSAPAHKLHNNVNQTPLSSQEVRVRGRFKLPPKRILFHGPDDEFMEARREWLDSYLQAVLADETLRTLSEVWDFLSEDSVSYVPDKEDSSLLKSVSQGISQGLDSAYDSVNSRLKNVKAELAVKSKKLDMKIEKMKKRWEKLEVVPSSLRPGGSERERERDRDGHGAGAAPISALAALRSKAGGGAPSANRTTNRLPPSRATSTKAGQGLGGTAAGLSLGGGGGGVEGSPAGGSDRHAGAVTFADSVGSSPDVLSGTGGGGGSGGATLHKRKVSVSRSVSLPSFDGAGGNAVSTLGQRLENEEALGGSASSQQLSSQASMPRGSKPPAAPLGPGGRPRTGAIGNFPSPAALAAAASAAASRTANRLGSLGSLETINKLQQASALSSAGADDPTEDSEGLSHPLLDMVAIVFKLQERGWLRRQILLIARQLLDLFSGGALDELLAANIARIRRGATVAYLLRMLRDMFWRALHCDAPPHRSPTPHLTSCSPYRVPHVASFSLSASAACFSHAVRCALSYQIYAGLTAFGIRPRLPTTPRRRGRSRRSPFPSASRACPWGKRRRPRRRPRPCGSTSWRKGCVGLAVPPPRRRRLPASALLHCQASTHRALSSAIAQTARALERLVGREQYREGALDVYHILQSPVFTRQIGFCLLESALVRQSPKSTLLPCTAQARACEERAS